MVLNLFGLRLHYSVAAPDAVDGCILKSNDDDVEQDPLLGYLAGTPGTGSRGGRQRGHACGTERSPWLVVARLGQRIRVTLMDFSSSTLELDVNDVGDNAVQSQMTSRQRSDGPFIFHLAKLLTVQLHFVHRYNLRLVYLYYL